MTEVKSRDHVRGPKDVGAADEGRDASKARNGLATASLVLYPKRKLKLS